MEYQRRSLIHNFVAAFVLISSLCLCGPLHAQQQPSPDDLAVSDKLSTSELAYSIAERSDRSDDDFGSSRVSARMVLINASGQTAERRLLISTLERATENEGDKSLVEFKEPRAIKGTKLLSHAKVLEPNNQWLYLPAIKRVKRVSSSNKSGPFVGSEFSIEDFTASVLSKYEFSYVGQELLNELTCEVIDRVPLYEKSGYKSQRVWVDTKDYQVRKVDYYDRGGALLKTLTLDDYRKYDRIWRPHYLYMVNHQTAKSTNIVFEKYDFDVNYGEAKFEKGVLARK